MSKTENPEALPLEQKCLEPGHWRIEGYDVRAAYRGRSRDVLYWYIYSVAGEDCPRYFPYLDDVRQWIRKQL